MLNPAIKDVWFCPERRHHVPVEMKTHLNTAKPGIFRPCCTECKERILNERSKVKTVK